MMGLTYHEFGIGRTALDMSYDLYSRGNHVGSIQSRIEFTDVFYRWAIPEVSFVGGMGVGSSHTDLYISSWSRSTSTDATQFFIRLGVPINEYVEINGAYHIMKISSSSIDMVGTDQQGNSTTTTVYGFDFSGELIGVGLTLKY
ncbi:MAG: hypothetical protein OEW39_09760 [Deltaproteobacteria bacterium]|nr:hypothetical protein [Deltaproteobacteria bacterium]